jgi:hypothetical protein
VGKGWEPGGAAGEGEDEQGKGHHHDGGERWEDSSVMSVDAFPAVKREGKQDGIRRQHLDLRIRKAVCTIRSDLQTAYAPREASIPDQYTAYSIRHALITALFDMGVTETQVNAFTGHSNNSHTALSNYFHLDSKWVGQALIGPASLKDIPYAAEAVVENDNQENLADEGIENEDQAPEGAPDMALRLPSLSPSSPSYSSPSSSPSFPGTVGDRTEDDRTVTAQISQGLADLFARKKASKKK